MSLIQDALRKTQEERDKHRQSSDTQHEPHHIEEPFDETPFFTPRRKLFYILFGVVVVVAIGAATFLFKPSGPSVKKNTRPQAPLMTQAQMDKIKNQAEAAKQEKSSLPVVSTTTQPTQQPLKDAPETDASPTPQRIKGEKTPHVPDRAKETEATGKKSHQAFSSPPTSSPPTSSPPANSASTTLAKTRPIPREDLSAIPPRRVPGKTTGKPPEKTTGNKTKKQPEPRPITKGEIKPEKKPGKPPKRPETKPERRVAAPAPIIKARPTKGKKLSPQEILISEGDGFFSEKNYFMAVDRYKRALKLEKSVVLYLKLYSTYRRMGNVVLADAYVIEGLTFFPDNFSLNKISAIQRIREKKFDEALKHIQVALDKNSKDYALLTYKGLCLFHKKKYNEALVQFRDSLSLNSDAVENYYYIALIYDNTRNYAEALKFYEAFSKLNTKVNQFRHREWVAKRVDELKRHLR